MDSTTITLITGGIIAVIGAIAAGSVTIINAVHLARKSVSEKVNYVGEKVNEVNEKSDNITVLVDGRYSDVLDRVATLQEMLADLTGSERDQILAKRAREDSDSQKHQLSKSIEVKKSNRKFPRNE